MNNDIWVMGSRTEVDTGALREANSICWLSHLNWETVTEEISSAHAMLSSPPSIPSSATTQLLWEETLTCLTTAFSSVQLVTPATEELYFWREQAALLYEAAESSVSNALLGLVFPNTNIFRILGLAAVTTGKLKPSGKEVTQSARMVNHLGLANPSYVAAGIAWLIHPAGRHGEPANQRVWVRGFSNALTNGPSNGSWRSVQFSGVSLAAIPRAGHPRQVSTPFTAQAALEGLADPNPQGEVRIICHENAAGEKSWSVLVPGTKDWNPLSDNSQDMASNLMEVGDSRSPAQAAVIGAMELAGIAPGEPVELVGHSQGGAVAAHVAIDPYVQNRYTICSVLTAGAPSGSIEEPHPGTLNLVDTADLVPGLAGQLPNGLTAYVSIPEKHEPHILDNYASIAQRVTSSSDEAAMWQEQRSKALKLDETEVSTLFLFNTGKVTL